MEIVLDGVKKAFGDRNVINNASLTLKKGERVCLFGPSGCGKTTLLRLICNLEKPDAGEVRTSAGMRIACHFQENRLLPWYTASENLALALGSKVAAQEWLARVALQDAANLYPDELSGGMRRRVSLARALGYPSDVLVLDEPLRELDTATCENMISLVDESIGDRLLILVTHDRAQAEKLGCRMIELPL